MTTWLTVFASAGLALGTLAAPAGAADALLPAPVATLLPATPFNIEERTRPGAGPGASPGASNDAKWRRRWMMSLAPLVVSQSLDAASSYGMRELNPLLAGSDGGFGMKATGIKFGILGGFMGLEYALVKKYPRTAKFFTVVNWTTAGATTGLAAHNFRLPRN